MTIIINELINNKNYKPRKVSKLRMNPNKICPMCNKLFYDTTRNRKYCSENCSNKAEIQNRLKYCREYYYRHKEPHYCKQCGKLITVKFRWQYCSNECYKKQQKEYAKEYHKKHKHRKR